MLCVCVCLQARSWGGCAQASTRSLSERGSSHPSSVCVCFVGAALSQAALDPQAISFQHSTQLHPGCSTPTYVRPVVDACSQQCMAVMMRHCLPLLLLLGPSLHLLLVRPGFGRPVLCVCMCACGASASAGSMSCRLPCRVSCMRQHGMYLWAALLPSHLTQRTPCIVLCM